MTPGEVIARALCRMAELDPDADDENGEPNWHAMRTYVVSVESALANAGFVIVESEA